MKSEVESILLFVAELNGSFKAGSGNVDTKLACGKQDYIMGKLPKLDLSIEEDRDELHEKIWLERLYSELDEYFQVSDNKLARAVACDIGYRDTSYDWSTPVEVDVTASVLMINGLTLGHYPTLDVTNATGNTLKDAWWIKGLPRLHAKKAGTPGLFGSSQPCTHHWKKNKLAYTKEHVKIFNKEMKEGPLGLANDFKELIINNVKPSPKMRVRVWNDTFTIYCNKFRSVGDKATAYEVWDSNDRTFNTVLHTDTIKVPDMEQFVRYFPTLFTHGIDSQIADRIMTKLMKKYGWGIPIHDAVVCSPKAVSDVRKWYAEEITEIYNNRKTIMKNFCESIGVPYHLVEKLIADKVIPVEGEFMASMMAMK